MSEATSCAACSCSRAPSSTSTSSGCRSSSPDAAADTAWACASGAPRNWPKRATARRPSCATTIPAPISGTSTACRAVSRSMRLEDFDYPFDESLIAQHPIEPRDRARLLIVDRRTGALAHHHFAELPTLLRPNDLIVLNDTQVIPARLPGHKRPSGGKVEVLLVRQGEQANRWHALVRGHVRSGQQVELPHGVLASVTTAGEGGHAVITFPGGRWADRRRGEHGGAGAGDSGAERIAAGSRRRGDGPVHLPRLSLFARGRAAHQLPLAEEHALHVGLRAGRTGAYAGGLPRGRRRTVSVLLLWRRDADPLT